MRSPNRTFRALLVVLAASVTLYLAFVIAISLTFRGFLYPAPMDLGGAISPVAVERTLRAKDGRDVHVVHFKHPTAKRTVVHFHGNAETVRSMGGVASDLLARGLSVMLVEYRGYGASRDSGPPTEQGLYLDAEAALDALAAEGVGSDQVVLWGMSLGTGVATEMAARGRGRALILCAPFTSITAIIDRVAPGLLPARFIARDRFDSLAKARSIEVPTLIVHGDADEVVPWDMGRDLSAAIAGARLITVPGAHHGDIYVRGRVLDLVVDWSQ